MIALKTNRNGAEARSLWLLDHGAAGHFSQVAGAADMVARAGFDFPHEVVPVKLAIRGWARGPLRKIVSHVPCFAAQGLLKMVHDLPKPPTLPPALILGSSGSSAWSLRYLGAATGAPTAFVGSWEPFPRDWFDLGLPPDALGPQEEATDFLISRATPESATAAAVARFGSPASGVWSLLIGGRSRSHHFDAEDWRNLAEGVNARAKADGIRWLISTSPRTGREAEEILAAHIDPSVVAELVLWGRKPDKCALAYMGAGERIFVTRDSLSMLSEAIASGKPTTALLPRICRLKQSVLLHMVTRMRNEGWTTEIACDALTSAALPQSIIDPNRLTNREQRIIAFLTPYLK